MGADAEHPFENIQAVDFDGDQYYNLPHIYCHFTIKGQPYESVDYYVQNERPYHRPFYTELVSQAEVRARSSGKQRRWLRWR
jgi:hypothetical protein